MGSFGELLERMDEEDSRVGKGRYGFSIMGR